MVRAILLLVASNVFMTIAWYGHLRYQNVPLWKVVLISWMIAFVEYCFMVPANRVGYQSGVNAFQLKMIQEVITLVVFGVFAVAYLKEPFHWKYILSFILLLGAVYFMFKK
ncbi:MAG: DMT family protein [Chitinophagaceae bacterium]|nr:DMT family protein [Chitinophagaceae bacterium]